MNNIKKIGIIFYPKLNSFQASISITDINNISIDINNLLKDATNIYSNVILKMRSILELNKKRIKENKIIQASSMWAFGNLIIKLVNELKGLNFETENLYGHLIRDLNVKTTTIKQSIIFRRYVPKQEYIPEDLKWSDVRDHPRRYALKLINGK